MVHCLAARTRLSLWQHALLPFTANCRQYDDAKSIIWYYGSFFFFLGRDNRVVINVERLAANTRGSPRVQMNNSNNKIFCTLWRIYDTIIKKTWRARELQRTTLARARNTHTSRGYLIFICLPNPNARGTSSGTATLVFIRRVRR